MLAAGLRECHNHLSRHSEDFGGHFCRLLSRLCFDVALQLGEDAFVLGAKGEGEDGLEQPHETGRVDGEVQFAKDECSLVRGLQSVANTHFEAGGNETLSDEHGVAKAEMLRAVELGDGAAALAVGSGVKIGCAEADGVGRDFRCGSEGLRFGKPAAVIRHVREQVKDGFGGAADLRFEDEARIGGLIHWRRVVRLARFFDVSDGAQAWQWHLF